MRSVRLLTAVETPSGLQFIFSRVANRLIDECKAGAAVCLSAQSDHTLSCRFTG